MADIVERLRDWHDYEPVKMFGGVILKDIDEAADEIERLRAALETLTTAVEHMRVPQTLADAALQVNVTLGPTVVAARALLTALNIHKHSET